MWYGEEQELVVDTHRSCDDVVRSSGDLRRSVPSGFVLASPSQECKRTRNTAPLAMPALPLVTPRPELEGGGVSSEYDGLVDKIDSELSKAVASLQWIPSLFTGQSITLPDPVSQTLRETLRSADATPSATPREINVQRGSREKGETGARNEAREGGDCGGRGKSPFSEQDCSPPSQRSSPLQIAESHSEKAGQLLYHTIFGALGIPEAKTGGGEAHAAPEPESRTRSIDSDVTTDTIAARVASMVSRGCSDQEIIARLRFIPGGNKLSIFRVRSMRRSLLKVRIESPHFFAACSLPAELRTTGHRRFPGTRPAASSQGPSCCKSSGTHREGQIQPAGTCQEMDAFEFPVSSRHACRAPYAFDFIYARWAGDQTLLFSSLRPDRRGGAEHTHGHRKCVSGDLIFCFLLSIEEGILVACVHRLANSAAYIVRPPIAYLGLGHCRSSSTITRLDFERIIPRTTLLPGGPRRFFASSPAINQARHSPHLSITVTS
jgi:hypothetical protein